MYKVIIMFFISVLPLMISAQVDTISKTRLTIGLSVPELLHIGGSFYLGSSNQFGISIGLGPTLGGVWPTLNAEHRLYIGSISPFNGRRKWFLRQGFTKFTADEQSAATFSAGCDLKSKNIKKGWTLDAGAFLLIQSDEKNKIGPALRVQYYYYLGK